MGIEVNPIFTQYLVGVIVIATVMLLVVRTDPELSRRAKVLGTGLFAILWPIFLVVFIAVFVWSIIKGANKDA